jgi:hypothetical protein
MTSHGNDDLGQRNQNVNSAAGEWHRKSADKVVVNPRKGKQTEVLTHENSKSGNSCKTASAELVTVRDPVCTGKLLRTIACIDASCSSNRLDCEGSSMACGHCAVNPHRNQTFQADLLLPPKQNEACQCNSSAQNIDSLWHLENGPSECEQPKVNSCYSDILGASSNGTDGIVEFPARKSDEKPWHENTTECNDTTGNIDNPVPGRSSDNSVNSLDRSDHSVCNKNAGGGKPDPENYLQSDDGCHGISPKQEENKTVE